MKQKTLTLALGKIFLALTVLMYSSGCTSLIVNPLLDPLTLSLKKQTDLQLLQDGVPSLLLLLDGLIASDPDNERLLMTAAKAYGAYATVLYEEGQVERAVTVSSKAKEYGINLLKQLPGLQNINARFDNGIGCAAPTDGCLLLWNDDFKIRQHVIKVEALLRRFLRCG